MRIKVATLGFLIADAFMLMAWLYYFVKANPRSAATHSEKVHFAVIYSLFFTVLLISLFVTMVLAWIWAQRQKEEYREQARRNLESLIEGTLRDHEKEPES